jgi:hypothetical protein
MKSHDADRHPGPWRVMKVDSESAGIILAVGFTVMGFFVNPIFVLGSLVFGVGVALLLRGVRSR